MLQKILFRVFKKFFFFAKVANFCFFRQIIDKQREIGILSKKCGQVKSIDLFILSKILLMLNYLKMAEVEEVRWIGFDRKPKVG